MFRVILFSIFVCLIAIVIVWPSSDQKRVALILDNSNYTHSTSNSSAQTKANDKIRSLQRMGYDVIEARNLRRSEIESSISAFIRLAKNADTALFYYSGYIYQSKDNSYIVPVDADPEYNAVLDINAVAIQPLLIELARTSKSSFVLFDVCKDNSPKPEHNGLVTECHAIKPLPVQQNMAIIYSSDSFFNMVHTKTGESRIEGFNSAFANPGHASANKFDLSSELTSKQGSYNGTQIGKLIKINRRSDEELRQIQPMRSGTKALLSAVTTEIKNESSDPADSLIAQQFYPANFVISTAQELKNISNTPGWRTRTKIASIETTEIQLKSNIQGKRNKGVENVIYRLQRQLARLGCYRDKIDGKWGPKSRRALLSFIQSVSLHLTDQSPNPNLLRLVESYSGAVCNVQQVKSQIAHSPSLQVGRIVPSSKTDPTLRPTEISNWSTEVERAGLSDVVSDDEEEWRIDSSEIAVERKPRARSTKRQTRKKNWQAQTLARMLESSD